MKGYISIKISTLRKISLALLSLIALGSVGYFIKCHYATDIPYVETKAYYELKADGRTVLYFRSVDSDSMLNGISLSPISVDYAGKMPLRQYDLHRMVEINRNAIIHRITQLDSIRQELYYYLDRHNVQDEGFDMVAERVTVLVNEKSRLEKWRDALATIDTTTHLYAKKTVTRQRIDSIRLSPVFVGVGGGVWTQGRWLRIERTGKGVSFDHSGRLVAGTWNADTMSSGMRYDEEGRYRGQTDRWMQACGHGIYRYADYTYEGRFADDREDGFGVAVSTLKLRAGEWKGGKFKGERMQYTSERIYGIDICISSQPRAPPYATASMPPTIRRLASMVCAWVLTISSPPERQEQCRQGISSRTPDSAVATFRPCSTSNRRQHKSRRWEAWMPCSATSGNGSRLCMEPRA